MVFVRRYVDGMDMARKNKNRKLVPEKNTEKYKEAKILRHIANLDLRTRDAYKAWCVQHGFNSGLKKTDLQRQRERQKHAEIVSVQRLRQHSRESKLRIQIVKISRGEVNAMELNSLSLIHI